MWDCFAVPRIRRANYGASTAMIAQQMCGINIISFYTKLQGSDVGSTNGNCSARIRCIGNMGIENAEFRLGLLNLIGSSTRELESFEDWKDVVTLARLQWYLYFINDIDL
ncbi:hypothetical protein Vi05172_g8321 [Venturia inaequalis]|nr:hypothetical protein Vi05172_g8321 [Venturia inaequalis]